MKRLPALYLCTAGMVVLTLTACASAPSPSPFPALGTLSQAEKAQVIRSRTTGLRTLTAVLTLAVAGGERQDTFDMVVNYDASGKVRFTAFKDLGLSTRPIFDLLFVGDRYSLEVHDEVRTQMRQGDVAQFVQEHPPFRAFLVVGEAFFLPGFDGRGNPPEFHNAAASRFTTWLKNGVIAQWFAKPDTLEITKARIDGERGRQMPTSFVLRYSDYRQVEAYYLPSRVTLIDPHLGSTTQALLKQVEINMPLSQEVFDIPSAPKEQSCTDDARQVLAHVWRHPPHLPYAF